MVLMELKRDASDKELRVFACILLPLAAVIFGAIAGKWRNDFTASYIGGGIAVALALVGFFSPRTIKPLFLGWMWLAFPLGWAISHALMAAVYYGVMTPIGLALRAVGKDPMQRRLDRSATTYWVPKAESSDMRRYFRQY